ncbi:selenide, water dikinase SelD [Mesorhizobium sp. CAU 1741]|uniref:selenide, water dikinase SelD n=1 Tax=Mesorhizobium sp. CAU 1741 TaxID=3140366 RepID=UPI00325B8142
MHAPVDEVRLTSLAHGGGCGCKLAPAVLQDLLSEMPRSAPFANLLVGTETADDAAVWDLDGTTSIIATTDFFMPMVDDPHTFGRIAATNAISDVYAMGGTPIFALAIVGMPIDKMDPADICQILAGGASICAEAGIPVAGGHSIDCPEPVYGLAVIGTCATSRIKRNSSARAGDALILTKGIGIGVYSAAIKKDRLSDRAYEEMVASTTLLNRIGPRLAANAAVSAVTDVTGFGILGHSLEMSRGAGASVQLYLEALPLLDEAAALAQEGCVTGASHRNWNSYSDAVTLPDDLADWQRHLLTDPQTSGGLLVAVASEEAEKLVGDIRGSGFPRAAIVGCVEAGAPGVRVVKQRKPV